MKNPSLIIAMMMALAEQPKPLEEAVKFEFCGECPMLSVTEKNQKRGEKHFCKKYNRQVFHMGLHPKIVRDPECDEPLACGYSCGYQEPYGFVPEAGCPVHDV